MCGSCGCARGALLLTGVAVGGLGGVMRRDVCRVSCPARSSAFEMYAKREARQAARHSALKTRDIPYGLAHTSLERGVLNPCPFFDD